jgi:hypothetical protein
VGDPSGFLPKSRRRAARYARLALTLVAALSAARRRGRAVVALTLCYGDHLPARTRRLYRNAIRRTYFGYGDAHDCTGSRPTPGPRGYSAGRRPLNGYPVTVQDDVPAIPAPGTAAKVAIFGDLRSGYALVERSGMTVQRLVELCAEAGEVGFKAHLRVGGGVIRAKSFAFLNVPAS